MAQLRNRSVQAVVAIVIAAISTACIKNDTALLCDQGVDDKCTPCGQDTDCAAASEPGEVCAADGACWPPNDVRTVTVDWTIGGEPANATTCEGLQSEFDFVILPGGCSYCEGGIYPPMVSCTAGTLVLDRVPVDLVTPDDIIIEGQQVPLLDAPWGDQTTVHFDIACIENSACGAGKVCSLGKCQP